MKATWDLSKMFRPRSVVLVGVSADPNKLSGRTLTHLMEVNYQGDVYLVNPYYERIGALKCYRSVTDLPVTPDLAVISLSAELVPAAIEDCARKGIKAAVVFSSGFAEVGEAGSELQQRVKKIAYEHNVAVCGPNCAGFINVGERLVASFSKPITRFEKVERPVTLITQSGALGVALCACAERDGIDVGCWISTGNEAVLNLTDYVSYFLNEGTTTSILCYAEQVRDLEGLERCAARALEVGKPLVLLKVGVSEAGARAAKRHTAADSISDGISNKELVRELGMLVADDLHEFLDLGYVFRSRYQPQGRNVAIITSSGGAGVFMADKAVELGFSVPQLCPETLEGIRKVLPPFASPVNPIDVTAEAIARPGLVRAATELVLRDPMIHSLVFFLGSVPVEIAKDIAEVAAGFRKPVLVTWMPIPDAARRVLQEHLIPVFPEPSRCLKALRGLTLFWEKRAALYGS